MKKSDCPSETVLSEYAWGACDDVTSEDIRAHCKNCKTCAQAVRAQMAQIDSDVEAIRPKANVLAARILSRMRANAMGGASRRRKKDQRTDTASAYEDSGPAAGWVPLTPVLALAAETKASGRAKGLPQLENVAGGALLTSAGLDAYGDYRIMFQATSRRLRKGGTIVLAVRAAGGDTREVSVTLKAGRASVAVCDLAAKGETALSLRIACVLDANRRPVYRAP